MNLRTRIEQNPTIVFLSALLVGFASGIGAYKGILEIAKLNPVSSAEVKRMHTVDEEFNKTKERLEECQQELQRIKHQYSILIEEELDGNNGRLEQVTGDLQIWIVYTTEYLQESVEIKNRLLKAGAAIKLWQLKDYKFNESKGKLIQFNAASAEGVAAVKTIIEDIDNFRLQSVTIGGESSGRRPFSEVVSELRGEKGQPMGIKNQGTGIGTVPILRTITTASAPIKTNEIFIWLMPKESLLLQ